VALADAVRELEASRLVACKRLCGGTQREATYDPSRWCAGSWSKRAKLLGLHPVRSKAVDATASLATAAGEAGVMYDLATMSLAPM
jgi:hypothetical protein